MHDTASKLKSSLGSIQRIVGAHSLLSWNSSSLEVMGEDLGTRTPKCSHRALKELLSFSSAVILVSSVQARVLNDLQGIQDVSEAQSAQPGMGIPIILLNSFTRLLLPTSASCRSWETLSCNTLQDNGDTSSPGK